MSPPAIVPRLVRGHDTTPEHTLMARRKPVPAATPKRAPRAAPAAAPARRTLYVLSDSTGNLARHMLTAFLTQFPRDAFAVRFKSFVQTDANVNVAFDEIEAAPGMVLHAVVSADLKKAISLRCRRLELPECDLTGPFVDFLARESGISPAANHRRLHDVDETYQNRIRALEFTLEHDDGLGLDTLEEADIVLAGVSRTSKTPTSIYLAQQGRRVANVSLAHEVEPPQPLLRMPARKVVALVIDPQQLAEIRTRRQTGWRMPTTSYNDPEHVKAEMVWARRLFARQGWPILDVTDQAIEETAARVLAIVGLEPASS
jgi:regulator of PEP synthase PpsR (kinase-PPPase family)